MHRFPAQNPCRVPEWPSHMHPALVDMEFAYPLVVHRPAHLQHGHSTLHLAEHLNVSQKNDGIGECRYVSLGDRAAAEQAGSRRGAETCDLLMFDKRRDANDEFAKRFDGADPFKGGETVDSDAIRLELFNRRLDVDQPVLEPHHLRVIADHAQRSVPLHLIEIDSPRRRIAEQLLPALLESQQQAPLAMLRSTLQELGYCERLPRSRRTGDQDDGIAEEATAAHLVESCVSGRNADVRRLLLELHRRERNYNEPHSRNNRERELSFLVVGTAELENLERSAASLIVQHVPENHHVVRNEFLDSEAGHRSVVARALGGENCRHPHLLQIRSDAKQLAADNRLI